VIGPLPEIPKTIQNILESFYDDKTSLQVAIAKFKSASVEFSKFFQDVQNLSSKRQTPGS